MTTSRSLRRAIGIAAALSLVPVASAAAFSLRNSPEYKRLPPTANAGYFLGYPSGTYSWHGCTASATKASLRRLAQAPPLARGTRQGAVTFTPQLGTPPYISWRANRGWTICGVQASAVLRNPTVDADLLAEIGYTSGPKQGATSATGRETISVPIPRKAIDRAEYERYEGKRFTIVSIEDVAVYVRRAG
ncbi:MAG TPA: hypothetical protein VKB25_15290 [Conexibacter sp.]|nr:hypothetical protein [Conexibacter sp.]